MLKDLQQSFRTLRNNPGFAIATVLVLALGIGANTAIFSIVNAALLRPLPYKDSSRLVQLWHVPPAKSFPGMKRFALSLANYLDWEQQNHVFDNMAIYRYANFDFVNGDVPESVPAGAVQSTFFAVLGVRPLLGRTFVPEENEAGRSNVVVLEYRFWKSHFGGDPKVVGRKIELNGQAFTVIGVMGRSFEKPDWAKIWTPIAWTSKERTVRGEHHYLAVARLRNGVTLGQAQAELDTISRRLAARYPEDDNGWGATVVPLREEMVGDVRPGLLLLLGAVGFVLLIACANVSNLVLAKTMARRKEMAIRAALGANRGNIIRHVLIETTMLSVTGGLLGLALATRAVELFSILLANKLPQTTDVRVDGWVLTFTLLLSVVTGALAGLLPALRFSQVDLEETLRQGLGKTDSDVGSQRSLRALIAGEVALSLLLLVGAGLMIRSLEKLRQVKPGIDANHVVTMTISISPGKISSPLMENVFFDRVLAGVRAVPGVRAAATIDSLPLSGDGSTQPISIAGRPQLAMADQPEVATRVMSPGYLQTMGISLKRGRDLNEHDRADSRPVALISESLALRFWPGEDPIGKHLMLTFFPGVTREVVGVVGDVKQSGLDVIAPEATLYYPCAQVTSSASASWQSFPLSLAVRFAGEGDRTQAAVLRAIHQAGPTVPVLDVRKMSDLLTESLAQRRFNMLLLAGFAGLALLLAALGIYSVLAYSVKRRTREIGLRMALGATPEQVLRLVVFEGMKPTTLGLALGLLAGVALSRVMASLLFGVAVTDALTFCSVTVLLGSVALLASIIPAYRATRVDPIRSLRDE
ncbi:MAG TPA: ABC transporter permease [Bryobacteraceae bacterium]|jgi:predicted permease|nr:ABC transporter permease [Bryobacteraceae bacterium]